MRVCDLSLYFLIAEVEPWNLRRNPRDKWNGDDFKPRARGTGPWSIRTDPPRAALQGGTAHLWGKDMGGGQIVDVGKHWQE